MARDESRKEAQHIADEFLNATPDTKLGKFLASLGSIALCRRKLIQYIKKQRLKIHEKDVLDSDGNLILWDVVADEEDLHMLYAIEPFLIFQQNDYGPTTFYYEEEDRMDITRITRGAFLDYFYSDFDIDAPTEVDNKQRVLQWERRGIRIVHIMVVAHHPLVPKMTRAHTVTRKQQEEVRFHEEKYR